MIRKNDAVAGNTIGDCLPERRKLHVYVVGTLLCGSEENLQAALLRAGKHSSLTASSKSEDDRTGFLTQQAPDIKVADIVGADLNQIGPFGGTHRRRNRGLRST